MRELPTGIYTATIKGRSVEEPAPADQVDYTVGVQFGAGIVLFDGVSPHPSKRWTTYAAVDGGEQPLINPFPIDAPVILHVHRAGPQVLMFIGEGEVPNYGGCPE